MKTVLKVSDPVGEYGKLRSELQDALLQVLASGNYVQGPAIKDLEENVARRCGVRYGISTASGTMALIVGLQAMGIGPGDEVIAPAYTAISTTAAITHSGASIVLADILPETLTIDPDDVARHITARTRAIIPVHLHGMLADMDALRAIAERHGLLLLEDAALALGAEYHGRAAGSLGDAAVVSFAPSKILGGVGWGGILVTNSAALARRARQLAGFGPISAPVSLQAETEPQLEGYNAQLGTLQAAALSVKLPYVDQWLSRRRAIATRLNAVCDRLGVERLQPAPATRPSYRAYVVLVPYREEVKLRLRQLGIEADAHFAPALHLRRVYARLHYAPGRFPVAERLTERILCLPCHPHLSDEDVERMADALESVALTVVG